MRIYFSIFVFLFSFYFSLQANEIELANKKLENYLQNLSPSLKQYQKDLEQDYRPLGIDFRQIIPSPGENDTPLWEHRSYRGLSPVKQIVVHNTEASWISTVNSFSSVQRSASAHLVLDREGKITPMVRPKDRAYHGGNSAVNYYSFGIEVVAYPKIGSMSVAAEGFPGLKSDQEENLKKILSFYMKKYKLKTPENITYENYRDIKVSQKSKVSFKRIAKKTCRVIAEITKNHLELESPSPGCNGAYSKKLAPLISGDKFEDIAVSPNSDFLVLSSKLKALYIYDLQNEELKMISELPLAPKSVSFDYFSKKILILFPNDEQTIYHYSLATGQFIEKERNPLYLSSEKKSLLALEFASNQEFALRQEYFHYLSKSQKQLCSKSAMACYLYFKKIADKKMLSYFEFYFKKIDRLMPDHDKKKDLGEWSNESYENIRLKLKTDYIKTRSNFDLIEQNAPIVPHMVIRREVENNYINTHKNTTDCPTYLFWDEDYQTLGLERQQSTRRKFIEWRRDFLKSYRL